MELPEKRQIHPKAPHFIESSIAKEVLSRFIFDCALSLESRDPESLPSIVEHVIVEKFFDDSLFLKTAASPFRIYPAEQFSASTCHHIPEASDTDDGAVDNADKGLTMENKPG